MNKICLLFLCAGLLSASAQQATISMFVEAENPGPGDAKGEFVDRQVAMERVAPDTLRVTVPVKDIPARAEWLKILPEFAQAMVGDAGYWVIGRGVLGEFIPGDKDYFESNLMIPIYGMKTPTTAYVAIVQGMRFEATVQIWRENGVYTQVLKYYLKRLQRPPYEDIVVDFVLLTGDDANYSGMGRRYRQFQLERGVVKSIPERIASGKSPYLDYLCDAMPLRMTHAGKPYSKERIDYTAETEKPLQVYNDFPKARRLLTTLKNAGVDKAAMCVAGWQTGGYDGRCPASFPVPAELGGEEALKAYVNFVQKDLGYVCDGHSNYTDCFTVSPMWSEDLVCKGPTGKLNTNGVWSGGNAHNLCARNAWETFFRDEIKRIADLGFRGAHYIDVFSAVTPYSCYDPKHPATHKEAGEYQRLMLQEARKYLQGAASECGWDHVIGELDYINYTSRHMLNYYKDGRKHAMVKTVVPLWEIVYHGIVLYNPDKLTQGELDAVNALRLVEFGGRPIFYGVSDRNIPAIAKAYEDFKPLRHLQRVFMQSHDMISEKVAKVTYADGTVIVCNYGDEPYSYDGKTVAPLAYLLDGK